MKLLVAVLLFASCAAPHRPESDASKTPKAFARNAAEDIGSSRNARIAIERGAKPATLTFFAGELTAAQAADLAHVAPNVHVVTGLSREAALARATEAHAIDARYASPEFLRAAKNLVWVQAQSAGVDRYVAIPELATNDHVLLTNMRGVSGPAIADHAFAMLLALTRDLPVHFDSKKSGAWLKDGSNELQPIALQDRTLLVVGLGGIGTEIARRGHGFGMRVIATRRTDEPSPDYVEYVGKPNELRTLLAQADVVAICVPLTNETEHMFDRDAFAAMKPQSILINVARGKIVDTDALVAALTSKRLGGACLDVTDPEPLPKDHALWRFPNVVITPHVAARAELSDERGWAVFRENMRRFDAGEPLLNVVDKQAGY